MISFDISDEARKAIAADKHNWEPRGNTIHDCMEAYLTGADPVDPGDYREWVEPLLEHPLLNRYECLAAEFRLVDKRCRYAGSLDALLRGVGRDGKERTILMDLKTLKRAHSSTRSVAAQCGAYMSMLDQHFPSLLIDQCVGLFSKPGKVDIVVHEPQDCLDAWDQQWSKYQSWQPAF